MAGPPDAEVFDRRAVRAHRQRAAAGLHRHDFLIREVAGRLAERIADIARPLPRVLELGCHTGQLARSLAALADPPGRELFLQGDLSDAMARRAGAPRLVMDEERLPVRDGAFDAVFSLLSLHWVNDLPGALIQARRALRPDGVFLAALIGGASLGELRRAWLAGEASVSGGAAPRVSPFVEIRDLGDLLRRAEFALPTVDADIITLTYADPFALMAELRGLGEANALTARPRRPTTRAALMAAAAHYADRFAAADGRIPATFEILYAIGWAPHPGQPRPIARGSATHRLADALDSPDD